MKLIYTHENRIMALNIRNVLINHGFDVALNNEFASSASGGLAPFDTWPEVWLLKDDDFDNAKKIIESISYNSNKQPGSARNVRRRMMNHLITVGSAMKKMNNLI